MSLDIILKQYKEKEAVVNRLDYNPYYQVIESGLSNRVKINGHEYIDLASNNYLGLANNDEIKRGDRADAGAGTRVALISHRRKF